MQLLNLGWSFGSELSGKLFETPSFLSKRVWVRSHFRILLHLLYNILHELLYNTFKYFMIKKSCLMSLSDDKPPFLLFILCMISGVC